MCVCVSMINKSYLISFGTIKKYCLLLSMTLIYIFITYAVSKNVLSETAVLVHIQSLWMARNICVMSFI